MSENSNNENNTKQSNSFVDGTKDAVNKVKNVIKETDFKAEAINAKNFFVNFLKSPIATIKSIASGESNNIVIASIILVLLVIANLVGDLVYYGIDEYLEITAKIVVLDIISPIIFVAVFSAITYFLSGKEKKNFKTVITAIIVAITPYLIRNIIYIVYVLINQALSIYFIYNIISSTINFITMILLMNAIKTLITKTDEEDKDFRRIMLIVLISYTITCVLDKLEIYSGF